MEVSSEFVDSLNKEVLRLFKRQYCDDPACDMVIDMDIAVTPEGKIEIRSNQKGRHPIMAVLQLTNISLGY